MVYRPAVINTINSLVGSGARTSRPSPLPPKLREGCPLRPQASW